MDRFGDQKTVVMGDSAGEELSIAVVLRIKSEIGRQPEAVVTPSACVDLTCSSESLEDNVDSDFISPIKLHLATSFYAGEVDLTHTL